MFILKKEGKGVMTTGSGTGEGEDYFNDIQSYMQG